MNTSNAAMIVGVLLVLGISVPLMRWFFVWYLRVLALIFRCVLTAPHAVDPGGQGGQR